MSRSRPQQVSPEVQLTVVLAVLAGELSLAEAARRPGGTAWRRRR